MYSGGLRSSGVLVEVCDAEPSPVSVVAWMRDVQTAQAPRRRSCAEGARLFPAQTREEQAAQSSRSWWLNQSRRVGVASPGDGSTCAYAMRVDPEWVTCAVKWTEGDSTPHPQFTRDRRLLVAFTRVHEIAVRAHLLGPRLRLLRARSTRRCGSPRCAGRLRRLGAADPGGSA